MTSEQQELNRKFFCAVATVIAAIPHFYTDGDEPTDASKMLEAALDIFKELHEDWRRHIGYPVTISHVVKAQWLRELADQIETEGDQ